MARSAEDEKEHLLRLVRVLKANPGGLWVRELARQSTMHMETARRLIEKYPRIFQEYADFTAYRINLKIVRLKHASLSPLEIDRFLQLAKKLETTE